MKALQKFSAKEEERLWSDGMCEDFYTNVYARRQLYMFLQS